MRNSLSEELQGFVVASLAPDHAPVRGVNVSQRDVIVRTAQDPFCFFQDLRGLALVPFLKIQPTLQHAHNGGHFFVTQGFSLAASQSSLLQGFIVLAFLPVAACVPEVCNRDQFRIADLILHRQHEVKMRHRVIRMITQQCEQSLRHPQLQVVADREMSADGRGKARQKLCHQLRFAIADVYPLTHAADECRGIPLRRIERAETLGVRIKQLNPAAHMARHQALLQLLKKTVRNIRTAVDV